MKKWIVTLILVLIAFAVGRTTHSGRPGGRIDTPPKVAGQVVPSERFEIDFSKPLRVTFSEGSNVVRLDGVRVLGFTGRELQGQLTPRSTIKGSFYEFFDRWIVLELKDKSRMYMSPSRILSLEVASQDVAEKGA